MVHAIPLRLRDETIGAMNIFNSNLTELTSQEVSPAQALADAATIGILQERAVSHGVDLAAQLQRALDSADRRRTGERNCSRTSEHRDG